MGDSSRHDRSVTNLSITWAPTIPPFPPEFETLPVLLRPRAEAAWTAVNTLLSAIPEWENWLNLARVEYRATEKYDVATGDELSRAGAAAIHTLCGLGLRQEKEGGHPVGKGPTTSESGWRCDTQDQGCSGAIYADGIYRCPRGFSTLQPRQLPGLLQRRRASCRLCLSRVEFHPRRVGSRGAG